jgi:hypothetical protein
MCSIAWYQFGDRQQLRGMYAVIVIGPVVIGFALLLVFFLGRAYRENIRGLALCASSISLPLLSLIPSLSHQHRCVSDVKIFTAVQICCLVEWRFTQVQHVLLPLCRAALSYPA